MTEREMEDLLWEHPEKFLNEQLQQFQRQPASPVGRADLIFLDRIGRLLVIELKRDTLERGAVSQLIDYYGMLKSRFPEKSVELMIVANRIPPERRQACEQYDIEAVEIPQKKFRKVAEEVGYVFTSEQSKGVTRAPVANPKGELVGLSGTAHIIRDALSQAKVKKGWYYWKQDKLVTTEFSSAARGFFELLPFGVWTTPMPVRPICR